MERLLIHLKKENLISDETVSNGNLALRAQFETINRHQEAYEAWFSDSPKGSSANILFLSMMLVLNTIIYSFMF